MFRKFFNYSLKKSRELRKTLAYEIKEIRKPEGKKIIAIAPHFDDVTLGCGGTIIKHLNAGDSVTLIYITDGTMGIPSLNDERKITEIRKKEAKNAMKIIGVKEIIFLDEKDGKIELSSKTKEAFIRIFNKKEPDIVYLPWLLDNHVDHVKANKLLLEAYKQRSKEFEIYAYEIWTPLIANTIVDITKEMPKKERAIKCFKSQNEIRDLLRIIKGLNSYRSALVIKKKPFAEAFLKLSAEDYFKFIK